ncbi:YAP1 binding protein 2 [Spathaspora passalidarum NRRL Y-27907]|uniref:YAP1 binding protein 2 n=1 Tax=Spathaspora passalidarum (strain NRRL Y-27907 / 11-Y1) TaxID=619300 RepID=G3ANU7_SPAPN|nr:YAP1 binding protein 2 [Spathaspora passalidarum NRRL Y-27907]EGW32572.1 YAP1 binding protein 2 [Spathaspora passalidarum NRRL Y-27907]
MSETDVSSDTTIEPFVFEKVLENLEAGCRDAIATKDYLSYSTLLDIYLSEPSKYTNEEKEKLLQSILDILQEHPDLTYKIGWDLPSLLLPYVDSDYQFNKGIRNSPCVYKILKSFECLARHGNPKELFLKCCELLSTIKVTDSPSTIKPEFQENFFDIKLYCIFELIDACLKRIQTLYPSRFLSMTVTSYINLAYVNLVRGQWSATNAHFILKRAYSFARNYINPPLPDQIDPELTKEELAKITEDEEYLQRKLLTGFLTQLVSYTSKLGAEGYSIDMFSWLQNKSKKSKLTFHFQIDPVLYDRLVELAYSYDIPLRDDFKKFIADSNAIFKEFEFKDDTDEDDLSGEIFERLVVDYQKNLFTSIIDSDSKSINDSIIGELILHTHVVCTKKSFDHVDVSIYDAVVMGLRILIPQMVQPSFVNRGAFDVAVFWSWYAIYQTGLKRKKPEVEFAAIPKLLLRLYMQSILFTIIHCKEQPNHRFMLFTLLSKILCLAPENTGYEFIKDTLENCPYEATKAPVIGVYKELLLKDKFEPVDNLEEEFSKASLDDKNRENDKEQNGDKKEDKPIVPPPLPRRSTGKSHKFFTFTEERLDDLLTLILFAQSSTFIANEDKSVSIDPATLSTLAAYLNLLIVLKKDKILLENKDKLDRVLRVVENNIDAVQTKHKNNPEANQFEFNAAGMLELTIERFKD